jgi:hypothetical protein
VDCAMRKAPLRWLRRKHRIEIMVKIPFVYKRATRPVRAERLPGL